MVQRYPDTGVIVTLIPKIHILLESPLGRQGQVGGSAIPVQQINAHGKPAGGIIAPFHRGQVVIKGVAVFHGAAQFGGGLPGEAHQGGMIRGVVKGRIGEFPVGEDILHQGGGFGEKPIIQGGPDSLGVIIIYFIYVLDEV